MSNSKETEEVPSEFNLKSFVEEWFLLQIYGRLPSFEGKGNVYNDLVKKRLKQGGTVLGVIFALNVILSFLPVFSIWFNNFFRLALLIGLPAIAIWVYIAQKKDKTDVEYIYNPPLPEETEVNLYQLVDDAIYVNYYNRNGYWYHLKWEDIIYAEIVPTQLYMGDKATQMIRKERNKAMLHELNERFNAVLEQVNHFPYEKLIIQNSMVSLELVTKNGVNLLPIPPSWIADGFVEDLFIYIDSKINERFYVKPEDINNIKSNFPNFFEYINKTIIKRQRKVEEFEEQLGFTTEDLKNKGKEVFSKVKNKVRGDK